MKNRDFFPKKIYTKCERCGEMIPLDHTDIEVDLDYNTADEAEIGLMEVSYCCPECHFQECFPI